MADDLRHRAEATIEAVRRRTGLDFSGSHNARMVDAVEQNLQARRSHGDLLDALTVGETYFFREEAHLDLVRRIAERVLTRQGPGRSLRVWSAGCASGEEAYTIGFVLEEMGLLARSTIVGTDLSPKAISLAGRALYGPWSLRRLDDRAQAAYFDRFGDRYRPRADVVSRTQFHVGNILEGPPAGDRFDIVVCRNVLIYLTDEAVAAAAAVFVEALAPGGWLITGASDPPLESTGLVRTSVADVIAYRAVPAPPSPDPPPEKLEWARELPRALHVPAGLVEARHPAAEATVRSERGGHATTPTEGDALSAGDRYHAALRHLHSGHPVAAAVEARAALYLEPDLVVAHLALAQAEQFAGDIPAARRRVRTAIALLADMAPDAEVSLAGGERAQSLAAAAAALCRSLEGA